MEFSKRGILWAVAGTLLVVALVVMATLAGDGGSGPALFVLFFWAGCLLGVVLSVRGALLFMPRTRKATSAWILLGTVVGMVAAVVLHNVVYALFGVEEAFFFILALWVGPVILVAAILKLLQPPGHAGDAGAAPGSGGALVSR